MKILHFITLLTVGLLSLFSGVRIITANDKAIADDPNSTPHHAIVPLKDLNIPPAQVEGETTISLQRLENSRVFTVPLKVGNISGSFLLDTGASITMVSSVLVQQLGLVGKPINSEKLTSAVAGDDCEDMSARLHQLPTIKMNQVQIEELRGLEFTNTIIPQNLSGVLGMDVLKNFDIKIHPKIKQLQLLNPSTLPSHQQKNAIYLQGKLGVMLAHVQINNQENFTFMFDTGADLIFISQQLAQQLNLNKKEIQPIQVQMFIGLRPNIFQGFCGLEDAEYTVLEKVQVNPFKQENLGAVILTSPSVLDLLGVDGILGQNFFQFYQQHWRFHSKSGSNELEGSLILEPVE